MDVQATRTLIGQQMATTRRLMAEVEHEARRAWWHAPALGALLCALGVALGLLFVAASNVV